MSLPVQVWLERPWPGGQGRFDLNGLAVGAIRRRHFDRVFGADGALQPISSHRVGPKDVRRSLAIVAA